MASSAQNRKGKGKAPPPPVVPEVPLGKQLAHTDKAVRDAAVRNLSAYLSRGSEEADGAEGSMENGSTFTQLNDGEMAKLWKGLFYCMSSLAALTLRRAIDILSAYCQKPLTSLWMIRRATT